MDETKEWYLSKGAWANLLQFLTSMAAMAHVVTDSQASLIVQKGPEVGVLLAMALMAILGFWGRLVATKKLS